MLTADNLLVDVNTDAVMRCEFNNTSQPDPGNPVADMFIFKEVTDVLQNSTSNVCYRQPVTVNDIGPFTCTASNLPEVGRVYSETSEELVISVTGKSEVPGIICIHDITFPCISQLQLNLDRYCMHSFLYNIVLVPPTIVKPLSDTTYTPEYSNTSFHVVCEAYGVPDVTLTLIRGGAELGDDEFTAESYNISGDWPYDVTQASGTRFYWRLDADYVTCSNVSRYDADDYTCVAANLDPELRQRNVTSQAITIETQCTYTI